MLNVFVTQITQIMSDILSGIGTTFAYMSKVMIEGAKIGLCDLTHRTFWTIQLQPPESKLSSIEIHARGIDLDLCNLPQISP